MRASSSCRIGPGFVGLHGLGLVRPALAFVQPVAIVAVVGAAIVAVVNRPNCVKGKDNTGREQYFIIMKLKAYSK
jgi:hypothetical protein